MSSTRVSERVNLQNRCERWKGDRQYKERIYIGGGGEGMGERKGRSGSKRVWIGEVREDTTAWW